MKIFALSLFLFLGGVNTAKAEVCFLPDGKGCEQVPYNEYACEGDDCQDPDPDPHPKPNPDPVTSCDASNYCYVTEAQARSARGTTTNDSYSKKDDCWCLKTVCSSNTYNLSDKGSAWNCTGMCTEQTSRNVGKYSLCTAKPCPGSETTSCSTNGNECKKCSDTEHYSGDNICQILEDVEPTCPENYSPNKPSSGCWNETTQNCGTGKCYHSYTHTCSGAHKVSTGSGTSCNCKCETGYTENSNGTCILNQCPSGVAENTCDPATHTFTPNNTSFTNTSGNTIRCGTCEENSNDDCSTWALWMFTEWSSTYHYVVSGAENVTAQYKDEYSLADDGNWREYMYKSCLNDTVTFSIEPTDCMQIDDGWNINGTSEVSGDTSFTFTMTQDFIDQYDIETNEFYNYAEFDFTSAGMQKSSCETRYGTGECVENTSHSGCYEVCHTKSYCENHLGRGEECFVSHTRYGRDCWEVKDSNQATIYCDYYEQRYNNAQNQCDSNIFSNSVTSFNPCEVSYTVKANGTPICEGAGNASGSYGLTSTTITAGTYNLTVDYSGFLGSSRWVDCDHVTCRTKCYKRYAPDILVVYDENPTSSFRCWQIGRREYGYHYPCSDFAGSGCYVDSVEMRSVMSSYNYNSTNAEAYIFDNFIEPSGGVTANCSITSSDYNLPSYTFEGGKTYYIRAGSFTGSSYSIDKCWYMDP